MSVVRPWSRIPARPSPRSIWSRLFWPYFAVFVVGLYGQPVLHAIRKATGSLPREAASAAIGWALAWLMVAAVVGGWSGGPWMLRRATTSWVLPSRFGPAVLARSSVSLIVLSSIGGAVSGAGIVLGFQQAGRPRPDGWLVVGAGSGLALAVMAVSAAMLVQPRRAATTSFAAALAIAAVVLGAAEVRALGSTPALGAVSAGSSVPAGHVWAELALAGLAAVAAVLTTAQARFERIDARARALAPLSVILFNRDLRSLRSLGHALTGEQPRVLTTARLSRLGRIPDRHRSSLRRSPLRRVHRVAMLVAMSTWGWWMMSLGTLAGALAVVVAAWLLAFEAAEPLGQELDRPVLVPGAPLGHRLRHLAMTSVVVAPALLAPALLLFPGLGFDAVASAMVAVGPGLIVASIAGAGHSLLRPESTFGPEALIAPEAFGFMVIQRESIPPLLVALGLLPLISHDRWLGSISAAVVPGVRGLAVATVALLVVIGVATWRERRSERTQR